MGANFDCYIIEEFKNNSFVETWHAMYMHIDIKVTNKFIIEINRLGNLV